MRILSVGPSVRLSNACFVTKRKKDVSGFLYHTKDNLAYRPRWSKIVDFQPIMARSASAVTPSEKVKLTLIGSPLRAFQ